MARTPTEIGTPVHEEHIDGSNSYSAAVRFTFFVAAAAGLVACAEGNSNGVTPNISESGRPVEATPTVGVDAVQSALRGDYAGLSSELSKRVDGAQVEDFMVVDQNTAVMGVRWGSETSENPVWGIVRLDNEQASAGMFPVELVAVGRDIDAMYSEGETTVVVFHGAEVGEDRRVTANDDIVRLKYVGSGWQLETPTGIVSLTEDQVAELPWGSSWIEKVHIATGGNGETSVKPTEGVQPTEEAVVLPPNGWFKWDGPTLMGWDAAEGVYMEYAVGGEAVKKSEVVIDQDGSRLTILKADKYGILYADKVIDAVAGRQFLADGDVYTNGKVTFVFNRFDGAWVQLPPERRWDEYLQITKETRQKWMNSEMVFQEDQLFRDNGEVIDMGLYPDQWPQQGEGNGVFQGVALGVSKRDGLLAVVYGFIDHEGQPRTTELVPKQGNDGLFRFTLNVRHTSEVYSTTSEGNQYIYVGPNDIPRVVEMFADRPVLVYFDIVSRNNPNDVGIDIPYCDIVQAEKAVSMGQAIANNNFSDEIFNREPGEGDGLTTPCGRFVIPAKQFVQ